MKLARIRRADPLPERSTECPSVNSILGRFKPLGRTEAGDLLLAPDVAAHLVANLAAAGVSVIGVGVWRSQEAQFEELYGVDLSHLPTHASAAAAQDFLARWKSDGRHLFSLITRESQTDPCVGDRIT